MIPKNILQNQIDINMMSTISEMPYQISNTLSARTNQPAKHSFDDLKKAFNMVRILRGKTTVVKTPNYDNSDYSQRQLVIPEVGKRLANVQTRKLIKATNLDNIEINDEQIETARSTVRFQFDSKQKVVRPLRSKES